MTTEKQQMNMADILDDLAAVLGIEEMPAEEREELIGMMGETILQNSLARFVESSDEVLVAEITNKMETMNMLEFLAYVDETYPDFGYIMNEETQIFLQELEEIEIKEL